MVLLNGKVIRDIDTQAKIKRHKIVYNLAVAEKRN